MSEKIYCKDCRFCDKMNGICHRWYKYARFSKVDDFDWCYEAEPRENVKDADCLHDEIGKMQAENKNLRGLITEIREFLIGGAIPGKVHLKHEHIWEIYTIASEEDEKRRNEK